MGLIRAMTGLEAADSPSYMTTHERLDFLIITLIFGVLFGVYVNVIASCNCSLTACWDTSVTSFTILTNQIMVRPSQTTAVARAQTLTCAQTW